MTRAASSSCASAPRPQSDIEALEWYAISVRAGREAQVACALEDRGLTVWMPIQRVFRRRSRSDKRRVMHSLPAMPRYLLIGWPPHQRRWRTALDQRFVLGFIGCGGQPLLIPASQVAAAQAASGPSGHRIPAQIGGEAAKGLHRNRLRVGATARIDDGPLCGHTVRIVSLTSSTAQVLLDLLSSRPVTIGIDTLLPDEP